MDRVLAVLFTIWALAGILPVGAWTGVTTVAYYAEAWSVWVRALALTALVTILVVVLAGERPARRLRAASASALALPLPLFLGGLGIIAGLEAAFVARVLFGGMPPIIDAWVQYFQARLLLAGMWVAPPPASPAHFAILFAPIGTQAWFGQYPPIHPALLALGMAAGAPWMVTPLLAVALPAVVYALGATTGDQRVARLAAVLVLLSPFVIAIDGSAMNHLPAALAVTAGLATLGAVANGSLPAGLALGAAVGLTLGLRPLDGVILALVGAPAVLVGLRARGGTAMAFGVAALGLVTLAPTLAYNHATTGSFTTFTYSTVQGTILGLDRDVPWGTTLTTLRAVGLTALDAHQLNVYLLEWPFAVTVLMAVGCWRGTRGVRAAAAYVAVLVGFLFFYFHRDTLYGPRLLFSAVPPALVLVAAGAVGLADVQRRMRSTTLGDVAVVALVVMATMAALTRMPGRLASYRAAGSSTALHPDDDARRAGIERALVLIPDGVGSRLIVRMWAGGVPMTATSGLYKSADACRLTDALATVEGEGLHGAAFQERLERELAGATSGRRAPGTTGDAMLRLPDDGTLSPRCAAEIARDRRGTLQFAPYLYLNQPRLDGPIVWAREMGESDVTLAQQYPDRPVYRYVGPQADGASPFVLLAESGAAYTPK